MNALLNMLSQATKAHFLNYDGPALTEDAGGLVGEYTLIDAAEDVLNSLPWNLIIELDRAITEEDPPVSGRLEVEISQGSRMMMWYVRYGVLIAPIENDPEVKRVGTHRTEAFEDALLARRHATTAN